MGLPERRHLRARRLRKRYYLYRFHRAHVLLCSFPMCSCRDIGVKVLPQVQMHLVMANNVLRRDFAYPHNCVCEIPQRPVRERPSVPVQES